MKRLIAPPLALGIALAAFLPAYAGAANAYRPVRIHRVLHHPSALARAEAPAPIAAFAPAKPAFGDTEWDGLSRNPGDCNTYGCIDTGGG